MSANFKKRYITATCLEEMLLYIGIVERSRKVKHGLAQDEHSYMYKQTPLVRRNAPCSAGSA